MKYTWLNYNRFSASIHEEKNEKKMDQIKRTKRASHQEMMMWSSKKRKRKTCENKTRCLQTHEIYFWQREKCAQEN